MGESSRNLSSPFLSSHFTYALRVVQSSFLPSFTGDIPRYSHEPNCILRGESSGGVEQRLWRVSLRRLYVDIHEYALSICMKTSIPGEQRSAGIYANGSSPVLLQIHRRERYLCRERQPMVPIAGRLCPVNMRWNVAI